MTKLCCLPKGQKARITKLCTATHPHEDLERRMVEFGLHEDAEIEVLHTGSGGHGPIAVRVNEMVVALRRTEAGCVTVEPLAAHQGQAYQGQPVAA
ncbi:ferrous iron transport protein A [bacterium]|nr:ferrous iron transport protein A [bacterium]